MSNEEIEQKIQEIVYEIKSQPFVGTLEEIQFQQILYFDKYVKDNIEYGFDAINYSMLHPNDKNPFDSVFKLEGFFKENEITGKRQAVCGSISQVANIVLNRLGVKCDYVYGHFDIGTKENPKYIGHRWNIVTIGGKDYMVDFTLGMVIHNLKDNDNHATMSKSLLGLSDSNSEYDYLFFDKLAPNESIGGFRKNENGTSVDDLDEYGVLQNCTLDPRSIYANLSSIPKEYVNKYACELSNIKTL